MKTKIYVVEVGVQQDGTEQEFEDYITKSITPQSEYFNFWDEDVCIFLDKEQAKKYATEYVKSGVAQTYALIYNSIENLTQENIQEIKDFKTYDNFNYEIPQPNELDFYMYKNDIHEIRVLKNEM